MTAKELGQHTKNEILSQPIVWKAVIDRFEESEFKDMPSISGYDQIIFTGCGSTHYLSKWAAYITEHSYSVISRALPASEIILFPSLWLSVEKKTLLVAISRSGETTETLRAVEIFHSDKYGDSVAITCYPEHRLAKSTTWVLSTPDAQEQGVAQTRSFTSMMFALNWLLGVDQPSALQDTLVETCARLFQDYEDLASLIAKNNEVDRIFFLGSGSLYGLASEAMLKMKEMSLTSSEAYHFPEFRHGPISMVDQRSLVVGLMTPEAIDYELPVVSDIRKLGAHILLIAADVSLIPSDYNDMVVNLKISISSPWYAPLYLPFLQLLALYRSLAKELDPDHPRNLSSVVVLPN